MLGGILFSQFKALAQGTDPCTQCNTSLFNCQSSCEIQYLSCLDADPEPGHITMCGLLHAICLSQCDSTWQSCIEGCGGGGGGGGSSSAGKDTFCVNACYEGFYDRCVSGEIRSEAASDCIATGESVYYCCNQSAENECIHDCPDCDPTMPGSCHK